MDKPIVFLSHSSKDSKALNRLKEGLDAKTHGTIDFFLSSDGESIPFGRNWVASLQGALDKAKLAFVFLSPHSVSSGWVHFEAGFMYSKGIDVVPVGMPQVDLAKVPPPLGLLQGFNIHSFDSLNNIFAKINKLFGTKHNIEFTKEEYQSIFEDGGFKAVGYFGSNERYIEKLRINFTVSDEFLDLMKASLSANGVESHTSKWTNTERGPVTEKGSLAAYGVLAQKTGNSYGLELTPEMAQIVFTSFDAAASTIHPSDLTISATFSGLSMPPMSRFSGKLYGTDVKVRGSREFAYKNLNLAFNLNPESPQPAMFNCKYSGKLMDSHLNELVTTLVESGAFYEVDMSSVIPTFD